MHELGQKYCLPGLSGDTASSQACGPWLLSDPASASPTKGTRQAGLAPWLGLDVPWEREQTHGREGLGSSLE